LAASLSGASVPRIYIVEPTGAFEDDPNVTNKRFPGNPTRSYRTRSPLKVVGQLDDWEGHPPEKLQQMLDHLKALMSSGQGVIED
jgi:rifampin ADP-ribosylating transferase